MTVRRASRATPARTSPSSKEPWPRYAPQLAQLVKSAPSGPEWLHEIKYDGYRIGCRIDGARVTLLSRNGKDWTAAFPEIVQAARAIGTRSALLDGEVCVVEPDGRTSFQALQNASSGGARRALVYFAFDLLYLNGRRLLAEPLASRKRALHALLRGPRLRLRNISTPTDPPPSAKPAGSASKASCRSDAISRTRAPSGPAGSRPSACSDRNS